MCDTFVALGNSTIDGSVIFAKNSDREANEAHHLLMAPAASYPSGSTIQCTYIAIPQVEHTYAVLLAKPFWMWGAEMGANEHGVLIGNEAVFTRVPYVKGLALTGMDLLRLGLERAATALEALNVITKLLETHGQGGNCGLTHGFYYHNSYIISDLREAWVLETAGEHWAAEKVRDIRSISNALTIGREWDLASDHLVDFAMEKGWCHTRADFDFAACYSDPLYTRFAAAHPRRVCATGTLAVQKGGITTAVAMQLLRSHGGALDHTYKPDHGLTGAEICMHAGFGPIRNSQTAGSMVSRLTPGSQLHWLTGTAAPCTGIFKPVWFDAGLPDLGPVPSAQYGRESLWWRHELLHREVLRDYRQRLPLYERERDELEASFLSGAESCADTPAAERFAYSQYCFQAAEQARQRWLQKVRAEEITHHLSIPYAVAWKGFNRQGGLS